MNIIYIDLSHECLRSRSGMRYICKSYINKRLAQSFSHGDLLLSMVANLRISHCNHIKFSGNKVKIT